MRGVKDKISRVPVFDTLSELIKEGIVKDQKVNRRDHRLVVDTNNPIIETLRELGEFENAYISLLEKVKEHINRRYYELKNRHYSSLAPSTLDVADGHPFCRALSGEEHSALDKVEEFFYANDLILRSLYIFPKFSKCICYAL
jgi:predicted transcriptional regulator